MMNLAPLTEAPMRFRRFLPLAALLLVTLLPAVSRAQGFECTIVTRQITIAESGVYNLLDPRGEMEQAEEFDLNKVFSIPMAQVLQFAEDWPDDVELEHLTYHIKGTMMRVDGGDDEMPGYALLDFGTGTFRLVQPRERMYLEMTKEDYEQMMALTPDAQKDEESDRARSEVRPMGESKQINGMPSSAFEITSEDSRTVAWVTAELKDVVEVFLELQARMESMGMFDAEDEDAEVILLVAEHGFPVLEQTLKTYEGYGGQYEISEVLSIERKTLSADMFAVQPDWERRSIMDMMGMFEGGN